MPPRAFWTGLAVGVGASFTSMMILGYFILLSEVPGF